MSRRLKAVVAIDDQLDPESIQSLLPGEAGIEIVELVEGTTAAFDGARGPAADLLVVACTGYSDGALRLVDTAVREHPERPVVVLSADSPNGFLSRVFEAGADDIVVLPEPPAKVLFALEKAVARKQGGRVAAGMTLAPMVCVLGPKGGTGKTLTAANLAVSLADAGRSVVVVDLDLQFGDIGLALGLTPDKTIYDLVTSGGSLDAQKLDAYLAEHSSGARALLAPTRPDHADAVTVDFLREVWRLLRSANDYVIVDTPPDFTPQVIAAVDACSEICMVGMLDSLSLKNTKLGLETLQLMGYERDSVRIVLNRAGTRVGITQEDVVTVLGKKPDVLVPSDRDVSRSVNEGSPIVLARQRSEAALAFRSLAATYTGEKPADHDGHKHRRFRRRRRAH
jgi:pilus assembly protein CpaE